MHTLMSDGRSRPDREPEAPGNFRLLLYDSGTSISWPPAAGWHFPFTKTEVPLTEEQPLRSQRGPALIKSTLVIPGSPLPVVSVADMSPASSAEYLAENAAATQHASRPSPCRILTRRN